MLLICHSHLVMLAACFTNIHPATLANPLNLKFYSIIKGFIVPAPGFRML